MKQECNSIMLANKLAEVIGDLCDANQDYALLDFPAHSNVGDSAIYLGELALLDKIYAKPPRYVCTKKSAADDIAKFMTQGVIFLHGGGNFGDIWPAHQAFRNRILQKYPDYKIVQLPQSIHFSDKKAVAKSAEVIDHHKDFTLLVRDRHSFDFAQENFQCDIRLCPDAAFALSDLQANDAAIIRDTLCILRTDKEKQLSQNDSKLLAELADIEDWLSEKSVKSLVDRFDRLSYLMLPPLRKRLMSRRAQMYQRHARQRVSRGVAQICSAKRVVSDRLHVHILSMILGKEHYILDNNYGKIQRFIAAWQADNSTTIINDIPTLIRELRASK